MNLLAIVGSPRKGKATDTLVDKTIEGFKSVVPNCNVKKINLIDYDIKFCKNCLSCRDAKTDGPYAKCIIRDDMDKLNPDLHDSDVFIFGTPVHMGYATALMTAFLERICWVFAKPEKTYLNIKGCPLPRSNKKRKAVTIITSGSIPPLYRKFCDQAAPLIKQTIKDSLNARTIGDLYAGDVEHRKASFYFDKAMMLGQKLGRK